MWKVALGYETKMRWNSPATWIWSDGVAQEPVISVEQFEAAQAIRGDHGRTRQANHEAHRRVRRPHVLRGLVFCGLCDRKMQGQWTNDQSYYRCRYPREYALATHVEHPVNVYLRDGDVLPAVDTWLARALEPDRMDETIRAMAAATANAPAAHATPDAALQAVIADCDARLTWPPPRALLRT